MKVVVYDKARWHLDGEWPEGVPEAQAYVLGGMLMGWLAERALLAEGAVDDLRDDLALLRERRITGPQLFRRAGGSLTSEDVCAAARAFLASYTDAAAGQLVDDFDEVLGSELESLYLVDDTWENFELFARRLDDRLASWRRSHLT